MMLVVLLSCSACASWARILVPPETCPNSPDHVHVSGDDPRVQSWYASHHQPSMEVEGHIFQLH